ncbi:hypothetical protein [Flavobacterium sp. HJSW_4]|uniref:hypothetical protein n=1 Tax=Flavobacterium sp. HJSW_4 TaxID=3344660 RepID=UPI0035F3F1EA
MGKINIIAKNFSENATGSIREDAAQIRNYSEKQIVQNGENGVNYDKSKDRKPPTDIRITKVEGPFDANGKLVEKIALGTSYVFKATPTRKPTVTELKLLKWAIKLDNNEKEVILGTANYNKLEGNKIILPLKLNRDFDKAKIYAFYQKSDDAVSVGLRFKNNMNHGGAFVFIIADELLPSGKIVRKVVVPRPDKIIEFVNGNMYEKFGMTPPNMKSNITIGEHAAGLNQSRFLSGSTLPKGAPNINGTPQYIDIKKAIEAGCEIHSTEDIVADLKRLQNEAPTPQAKARLEKVINAVQNVEGETLIEGHVPANAIKSPVSMKITKGLRIVNIIGIVITAYELEKASEKSFKQNSIKPIAAETIRQVGGWGGAIAGAKIGAATGVAIGIETGPGALISGAIGSIFFGTAGYFGADWIADYIDEN